MMFGILEWASGSERIAGRGLSAWSERLPPLSVGRFLVGILTGSTLHGQRGFQYARRRYLAGLLSPSTAILFAIGMAIGMFLPATAILLSPFYWAYPLLILGMAINLTGKNPAWRESGKALIGLGCCGIGYHACLQAAPAFPLAWAAIAGVAGLSVIIRTPAPLFLATASLLPPNARELPILLLVALSLALVWLITLGITLWQTKRPFSPPLNHLNVYDLPYPERALQAVLQELRRNAQAMADAAHSVLRLPEMGTKTYSTNTIKDIEAALDEGKPAAQRYLLQLSRYTLRERQAQLLLFLFINISDIERISDHLLAAAQHISRLLRGNPLPKPIHDALAPLLQNTVSTIDSLAHSITGNRIRRTKLSGSVLEERDKALQALDHFTNVLQEQILQKKIGPAQAIRLQELRSHLERLIRHIRAIAVAGEQEDYWIEPDAIHERARLASRNITDDPCTTGEIRQLLRQTEALPCK